MTLHYTSHADACQRRHEADALDRVMRDIRTLDQYAMLREEMRLLLESRDNLNAIQPGWDSRLLHSAIQHCMWRITEDYKPQAGICCKCGDFHEQTRFHCSGGVICDACFSECGGDERDE